MGRIQKFWNRVTGANQGKVFLFGRNHVGGVWLSHDEALKIAVVWACVTVISKAIASSQWDIFTEDARSGDRIYQTNSRVFNLLNSRPNKETTPVAFHETMVGNAALWGDAFAEIEFDSSSRPSALWQLEPFRCTLMRGFFVSDGFVPNVKGELAVQVINFGSAPTYLRYSDVYHIHGFGVNGTSGLDLCGVAAKTFLQKLAMDEFALKFYENGTAMGGVLSTEEPMDEEKMKELRDSVKGRVSGVDNAFSFLVLGGGLTWQSLANSLGDNQNIESQYLMIEETCRFFGVPPHKVAHLLRSTFSNIEHQGIEFHRDTLTPWAIRCQQEAQYKILPVGTRASINLEWASEGDAKTKMEVAVLAVNNALATRNEYRRKFGQNSLGKEGEMLTVQGAMTTLEKIAIAPPPGTPKPGAPDPAENDPNEAEPQTPPKKKIANTVLLSAAQRVMRRQTLRANDALRGANAKHHKHRLNAEEEFRKTIEAGQASSVAYAKTQFAEAVSSCLQLTIEFNSSGLNSTIEKYCAEEKTMLLAAYPRNIAAWCNIEQRAGDIANALTEFAI